MADLTEADVIQSLIGEITGDETQETQDTPESKEENTEAIKSEESKEASGLSEEAFSNAVLNALSKAKEQEQTQTQEEPTPEQLQRKQTLEQLGIGNYDELAAQVEQMKQMQQEAILKEQKRQTFNKNLEQFSKDFPTIKPEDMGKWAETNGFLNFLGDDYTGWKLVAQAMMNVATPKEKPDNIIGNTGSASESNVFEKIKKGEDVSNVDLGSALLGEL
ncbi:hypothetical protein CPIN17260_1084 [Campylobacter pinnipediorum subsp. pinnipediorum]|uniref:Scaffolding protein n=1 Tax=Campylobacter pinnipediorum subsp. pinnipediorum TaxID=1660067 RepID=A0AAX0L9Y6_9BACT|nr:hypothetical protein [Campylobacter pinnipediorum]AQW81373.1 hypothetical protein CPIN17260_1084 [Campylobacter pinnipediorum subsp. pinnipediorum]OPA77340.1 hypothetical protein BFG04_04395 [Campylobacter pinnipediorum subsp. pinnipediorum]